MKFIKHNRYLDVCIQVLTEKTIERSDEKFLMITGWFWNMAYVKAFNTGQWATVEIKLGGQRSWLEFETSKVEGSLRDVEWR
jgi:hypothetical protein